MENTDQLIYATDEGRLNARASLLKSLSGEYFARVENTRFVVIGKTRGVKERMFKDVLSHFGIHSSVELPRIISLSKPNERNIEMIADEVCSPGCLGFIGFNLSDKQKSLIKKHFKKRNIWDEYYNIFFEEALFTRPLLTSGIERILEVVFEDELAHLAP